MFSKLFNILSVMLVFTVFSMGLQAKTSVENERNYLLADTISLDTGDPVLYQELDFRMYSLILDYTISVAYFLDPLQSPLIATESVGGLAATYDIVAYPVYKRTNLTNRYAVTYTYLVYEVGWQSPQSVTLFI